jgi:hypothetical protein
MSEFKKFTDGIAAFAKVFKEWAEQIDWTAVHDRINYLFNELPKGLEKESINLMNRGWFIWFYEGYIDDFTDKMVSLIGKSRSEQDIFMTSYVKQSLERFRIILCSNYPYRDNQIKDAFSAHNAGLFYSSIPVFLALSEGIARDLYPSIGLFAKHPPKSPKAGLPRTTDIFDSISGLEVFEKAVLIPLQVASDVTKTIMNPTPDEKKIFNRHLIMHGISDSYGSEENSLKAISLTYFVHASLSHLKSKVSNT